MLTAAAITYCILIAFPIACQMALSAGAPWGELTMGGLHPGRLPRHLRLACTVQAMILMTMGLAVADYAGLLELGWHPAAFWVAFAITALTAIANTITPSKPERLAWAPVTIAMLACTIVIIMVR